ncbi:chemotaxis protein CheW [Stenotrophomonas sp. ZAC14D1_NAIMI4_6]|uniref:chemotaxis protein CheW n=1 Tax=unclassified Stenotrophomonas maltophilia group TaxID=2961925 RepID=UPI000D542086|nr:MULTISPECIES: chemotaxis protein CheW [unclassified Stenotrophomonas maltophilia group]AWH37089.1 chemotaxis protein CheW [Stenotrophomonas sp. ZAC14D1_NAIMI4_6]AWH41279.1 chemotaxis protein CheW [Stenotrophomonas sp. ZAC14D1_NAIMI4_1]
MNTPGVLDDYLDELLGEAIALAAPPPPVAAAPEREPTWDDLPAEVIHETGDTLPGSAGPCPASAASPEGEPTWDDLPAEVVYETGDTTVAASVDDASLEAAFEAAAVAAPEREPTWDDLPSEVIYETGDTDAAASVDDASLEAAFEAAAVAAPEREREPTWDDLPAEVIYETGDATGSAGPGPASAAAPDPATDPAAPKPTWDDLPDEVIYETDGADSHRLAHTDSPALQAAFEAAAVGEAVPAPAPAVAAPIAPVAPRPAPAPAARAAVAPPPRIALDAPPGSRPGSWQELQAQAHQPPHGANPHNRRAAERTSRWLRLRCGTQAYALELLKVQEVVLPVPLLPLRGTAPAMLGIMNLRGQVVPVMDLGIHLGAVTAEDDAQTRIVVLEENGETLGLRVSAVEDVANLTDSQIEPPDTARICQISNELFRGVARISQRPMILLDATRLLG